MSLAVGSGLDMQRMDCQLALRGPLVQASLGYFCAVSFASLLAERSESVRQRTVAIGSPRYSLRATQWLTKDLLGRSVGVGPSSTVDWNVAVSHGHPATLTQLPTRMTWAGKGQIGNIERGLEWSLLQSTL